MTAPEHPLTPDEAGILLLEIDIAGPILGVSFARPEESRVYGRARCLVRAHTKPLGIVPLESRDGELSAEAYTAAIWQTLRTQILAFLQENDCPPISGLAVTGLPDMGVPRHLRERQALLENPPFVSVIIATRDRPDSIAACLQAFTSVIYPCYEIIVVDNAPTSDATARVVARFGEQMPHLRCVREEQPGLSWARNRGLEVAQGEIVVVTDDDIVPDWHWLSELLRGFQAGANVACVTGPILPAELKTQAQIWIEGFGGFNKGFERKLFDCAENRPNDPLFPYAGGKFGSGANIAFKADVLRALGGFDPALGAGSLAMSGEEFALFVDVLDEGYQIAYEPGALIYHTHHRDYASLKRQIYGYAVGLTAYLVRSVLVKPRRAFDILKKVPPGVHYALSATSPKNEKRQANYPGELKWAEIRGMLYGPLAYARSRCDIIRRMRADNRRPPAKR